MAPARTDDVNGVDIVNGSNGTNGVHIQNGANGVNGDGHVNGTNGHTNGLNGHASQVDSSAFSKANASLDYDVLIVGAGLSGIFSLHRMRQLGLRTRVIEAGSGEGGTWFW